MNKTEIKIATTDLSAGIGVEQLAALKAMTLAVIEMIDEGDLPEESIEIEPEASYQSIGKIFTQWAREVRVGAKGLN